MPRNNSTSEVGFATSQMNMFREFMEAQSSNFAELIKSLKTPSEKNNKDVSLPKFNPECEGSDAEAWCRTIDFILVDNPLEGSALIVALSGSLEGEAAQWLAQVCYPGIQWTDIKEMFIQRFKGAETTAAAVFNVLNSRPKEGECISTYSNRLVTSLLSKWNSMTVEEIAVSVALAQAANIDSRVQRLLFTTKVKKRNEMQQELKAFSYGKRKIETNEASSNLKRFKSGSNIKCHFCGKLGHKIADCRSKNDHWKSSSNKTVTNNEMRTEKKSSIICFKCGKAGHIATSCNQQQQVKRVDVCTVIEPKGKLFERGECFNFYFDSGAECSLIKESVATKFAGNSKNSLVTLKGIGNSCVYCTMQIDTNVIINDYSINILFHVLPDDNLKYDIIIGREILNDGFCVTVDCENFTLNKLKLVDICSNVTDTISFEELDTDLTSEERPKLISMLHEYSKWLVSGVPHTRVTTGEMQIRLVDPYKTVQRRPYRLSPDEREIVRQEVKNLINAKVIQPSNSPFASPIILVKKKNGSHRMCVDYRQLNANTVSDKYPLPLIADQIARLGGATYFSQLDMASGFHQVPVHPDSTQYTAFVTPDGHYEYLTMPFGLKNAPACFQRAINAALGDLAYSYVIVYMDDVMIIANNKEQAFDRLKIVLDVLTKAGFCVNLKKCAFLKTSVNYLGYAIRAGQIRPNPLKIVALSELPPPQSVTQLRQFIGLASYFRQFIAKFSIIMKPLYNLVSNKTLHWKDEHEQVRQKIISVLTSEPILVIFDPKYPIELHTDASSLGYGAILFHKIDNKLHVIEYFSKTTTSAESRYDSYELETLAVVNSIKHFRHYLVGRTFTVFTDCNALEASRTKQDLTPRAHRWWSYLQCFDFEIHYREGKRMSHVDFLSRNPIPSKKQNITSAAEKRVDLTTMTNDWLMAEQQMDQDICAIVTKLQNNQLSDDLTKTYELRSGVLYRKIQRIGKTRWLPIVPRSMRWSVINNIHESIMHLGFDKTLDMAYKYYWFDNMSKYIKKFVDNCITCKVSKKPSGKVPAELHPIPKISIPWHTIHVDITGKLSGKNDLKEYLIVTIDSFTKYVLLFHTTNLSSESCINALKSSISLFGVPGRIIADQGRCFTSKDYKDFCSSNNISLHLIATGSSRANGQVERVMGTLRGILTAVETSQRSWQDAISEIQLAINSTVSRVTKSSPLELLIGREARPFGLLANDNESVVNRAEIRESAVTNMQKSANYEQERFNKNKAPVIKFKKGDFVLIKNEDRHQTKLDPKFKGPFKIVNVLDGDRYMLKSLSSNRLYKYAHENLRKMPSGQNIDECDQASVEIDAEQEMVKISNENEIVEKGNEEESVETDTEKENIDEITDNEIVEKGNEEESVETDTEKENIDEITDNDKRCENDLVNDGII